MASSSDPYRGLSLSAKERKDLITSIARERGIKYRSAQRYVQRLTTETGKQKIKGTGKLGKQFGKQVVKVKSERRIPAITRGGELIQSPPQEYAQGSYIFYYYDELPEGYKSIVWDSPETTQSVYNTREDALHVANGYLGGFKWEEVLHGTGNKGMIHKVTVEYVPAGEQDVYQKVTGKRQRSLVKEFRQGGYHLRADVGVPYKSGKGGGGGGGGAGESGYENAPDQEEPVDEDTRAELDGYFDESEYEEEE